MVSPTPASSPPLIAAERSLNQITDRRITLMMWVIFTALLLSAVAGQLTLGFTAAMPAPLVVRWLGVLMLSLFLLLERRGHGNVLIFGFLACMTALLHAMAWVGGGPVDGALFACLGIFVIAASLCSRLQFGLLVAVHVLDIVLLYLLNLQGWYQHPLRTPTLTMATDTLLATLGVAFVIGVFARDMKRFKRAVQREIAFAESARSLAEFHHSHDMLTGLPNRGLGQDRAEQVIATAQETGHKIALLHIDLSDFRFINDSLGHAAGDVLLKHVSSQLKAQVSRRDALARIGSDEFMVALHGPASELDAALLTERLLQALAVPAEYHGMEMRAEACVGVAMFPDDGIDFAELSKGASIALDVAKQRGEGAFSFVTRESDASAQRQMQMIKALRLACEQQALQLHFQPQYELPSTRLIGGEALLRWEDPALGMVSPAVFLPMAEASGLMLTLSTWVLKEACISMQRWRRDYQANLRVAVNVSPTHLKRGDLLWDVKSALQASGLPPSCLVLEFKEALLQQDREEVDELLGRLRALGVGLAVDGFGLGHNNLSHMKAIQLRWLKLDLDLVRRVAFSEQDRATVQSLVQMTLSSGISSSAAGIETAEELAQLMDLGCRQGQGHFWSPALPSAEFARLVQQAAASTD